MSHYADASLPQQLDAFVWFDESSAVTLLARSTRSRARPTRMALASTAVTNQSDLHGMDGGPDPSQAPAIQVAVLRTQGCKISVCRSTAESAWTGSYVFCRCAWVTMPSGF